MSQEPRSLYRQEAIAARYEHYWGRMYRERSCSLVFAMIVFFVVIGVLAALYQWFSR